MADSTALREATGWTPSVTLARGARRHGRLVRRSAEPRPLPHRPLHPVSHAVLLAGGKGTRLRPYTTSLPKPLVPLGEQSIVEIVLRQLARARVRAATLAIGHLGHLIEAVVGDGSQWGISVDYVTEDEPLGTMGPVVANLDRFPDQFLVMNGDVLTDLDYARGPGAPRRVGRPRSRSRPIVARLPIDFGVLETDEDRVVAFREKPTLDYTGQHGRLRDLALHAWTASRRASRSGSTISSCICWKRARGSTRTRSTGTGSTSDGPRTTTRPTRTTRGCGRSCSDREVSGVLVIGAAGLIGRAVFAEAERNGEGHGGRCHAVRSGAGRPGAAALGDLPSTSWLGCSSASSRRHRELRWPHVGRVGRAVAGERGTGRHDSRGHAHRRARCSPGPSRLGRGVRRGAEPADRRGRARSRRPRHTPSRKLQPPELVSEAAESGLDTVVARVFNPIGPGMPPTSLPGRAARLLRDAVVDGAPRDRARPARCRPRLRRPPRRLHRRAHPRVRATPAAQGLQRRERSSDRRQRSRVA